MDRDHIKDLLYAPEDTLSFAAATAILLQTKHTFYPELSSDIWHTPVVRTQLTQRLPALITTITDELEAALVDFIPLTEGITLISVLQ